MASSEIPGHIPVLVSPLLPNLLTALIIYLHIGSYWRNWINLTKISTDLRKYSASSAEIG